MSFRLRRKNSGHGSLTMSTRRKSTGALQPPDLDLLIQKRQRLPDWLIGPLMVVGPAMVLALSAKLSSPNANNSNSSGTMQQIYCSSSAPLLVLLLTQLQLFFLWHLPAKEEIFPYVPQLRHRSTAFESCVLICLLYILGAVLGFYPGELVYKLFNYLIAVGTFPPLAFPHHIRQVFVHWPAILASLCVLCFLVILLIFTSLPCPTEQREHSLVAQLFYGRHLRPVLLNVDIKAFVTCRLALTMWAMYLISAAFYASSNSHKQLQMSGHFLPLLTTICLQAVYVLRRQWFEHLHTGVDNRNDRAGFYRLWAVLGVLPAIYVLPITIGAQEVRNVGASLAIDGGGNASSFVVAATAGGGSSPLLCAILFLAGLFFQWLNTAIDHQRHRFRQSEGQMKFVGGKDPFYICARLRRSGETNDGKFGGGTGEPGIGLLLGSGYWALCRHPNYGTEFCTFLCWSLPWWNSLNVVVVVLLPMFTIGLLLWWRMRRDELRCSIKYGQYWAQYCQHVPNMLVPGIY